MPKYIGIIAPKIMNKRIIQDRHLEKKEDFLQIPNILTFVVDLPIILSRP